MKVKIYPALIFLFLISIGNALAQESTLGIMAKYDQKSIKLKIVPKDAHHWLLGIDNGYVISRREIGDYTDFKPIHSDVLKPAAEDEWTQSPKGKEMYDFHIQSIEKIRNMKRDGPFLKSFKSIQRANENYKMYAFISMRDKVFGDYTGLEFSDFNIEDGKLYEYKVEISETNIESKSIIFDAQYAISSPVLNATAQEKAINLSWIHDENTPIIGYYLERSETGLNYDRMHEGPILPNKNYEKDTADINRVFEVIRIDSLTQNYQPYHYRIIGLDAWGDELAPSEPVVQMGVDLTAPTLGSLNVTSDTVNQNFIINWDRALDTDIASYFITRSYVLDGIDSVIVQDISPKGKLEYIVENPLEMVNHYFKVGAIDTAGNIATSESQSVYLPDHTPPTQIEDINFIVDSTGIVRLSWSPSFDTNLKGYWVFRSFEKNGDYLKITDTVQTNVSIIDSCSLSLLNNKRYYFVKAIDKSFNTSKVSEIIEVKLPDTIPPAITNIKSIILENETLKISWEENQSEDVAAYLIYKKSTKDDWKLLQEVQAGNSIFMDTQPINGKVQYQIKAKDENGNICQRGIPFHFSPTKNNPQELRITIDKTDATLSLQWNKLGTHYKLYKSSKKGFQLLDYLTENRFEDEIPSNSNDVAYYVKAFDNKGKLITTSEIKKL